MSEINKNATEYCKTIFTDETGNDEALIHNMRFMAYAAGAQQTLDLFLAELEKEFHDWDAGKEIVREMQNIAKRMRGE